MTLRDAAEQLYGLPPDEFTVTRNQLAKQDPAIKALRKPTVAAWLINMLVRRQPDEVQQVLDLGEQLRSAQDDLDGTQLRDLDFQRRHLTAALTRRVVAIGSELGHPVSDGVSADIEATLSAALADKDASAALASGWLVKTFHATGWEAPDLSGVLALDAPAPRRPKPPDQLERKRAQRAVAEARDALRAAQAAQSRAEHEAQEPAARNSASASRAHARAGRGRSR